MNIAALAPAYNEAPTPDYNLPLAKVLYALGQAKSSGLLSRAALVDDGSDDFTATVGEETEGISCFSLQKNMGKSKALYCAINWLRIPENHIDALLLVDTDFLDFSSGHIESMIRYLGNAPDANMVRAAYKQEDDSCPMYWSGIRLVRTDSILPIYDKTHQDYEFWLPFFEYRRKNVKVKTATGVVSADIGFAFELILEQVISDEYKRDMPSDLLPSVLHSRKAGNGSVPINQISAAKIWFDAALEKQRIKFGK